MLEVDAKKIAAPDFTPRSDRLNDMGIDALEIAKDLWNESVTERLKAAS